MNSYLVLWLPIVFFGLVHRLFLVLFIGFVVAAGDHFGVSAFTHDYGAEKNRNRNQFTRLTGTQHIAMHRMHLFPRNSENR